MLGKPLASLAAARSWTTPRNLIIAGALVNTLAILLAMAAENRLVPLRVVLILTGLVLTLVGVNRRLRNFIEDVEERGTTAAYLALGSFAVLLAYLACSEGWDSFRLALGVFVGVGLGGALLVLLPRVARRCVIVVLVLFHFGGILTAVFSVAPANTPGCWMTSALWTYIYRPYLQFMYLNNAYHFYSPEPGPATQLWFCVRYDDPNVPPHWVQLPRPEDYQSRLLYQRAIAMSESTTYGRYGYPGDMFGPDGRVARRVKERMRIPYDPTMQTDKASYFPDLSQYREPFDWSAKKYVASYARHVARDPKYRSPDSPEAPVKSVKVYRVLHKILSAIDMGEGVDPQGATTFMPVYMGEFDGDGNLLDGENSAHPDPLLYWVVPIVAEQTPGSSDYVVKNYVTVHAGSEPPFVKK
jgi:hypothetical protein